MIAMPWSVETLNDTVDAELAELPPDMRARLVRIAELIESVGLPNVGGPHVRHVRGTLRLRAFIPTFLRSALCLCPPVCGSGFSFATRGSTSTIGEAARLTGRHHGDIQWSIQ